MKCFQKIKISGKCLSENGNCRFLVEGCEGSICLLFKKKVDPSKGCNALEIHVLEREKTLFNGFYREIF